MRNSGVKNTPKTFWKKIKKLKNGCWEWQLSHNGRGYGAASYNGKDMGAHRLAFKFTHGYLPNFVCHTCDNPSCCNPKHLFAGDAKTNALDRTVKGRTLFGNNHRRSKLTDKQVLKLRKEYIEKKIPRKELAQKYNISLSNVYSVVLKNTWKHVREGA